MWWSGIGCLVTLILSLLAAPLATTAQPQGKIPRVAVLEPTSQEHPAPCLPAFQQGLRDLGYVEGQTMLLDYRYGEGHADRLPTLPSNRLWHAGKRSSHQSIAGHHAERGRRGACVPVHGVTKTICFSRSSQMHDIVIGLFVNRYEFGLPV
jgi:hypothetical protein